RRPRARTSPAVSAASERWTSPTSAPSAASRVAIARPMPRLAPVTRATFFTSGSRSALDVTAAAVRPEHEVALAIGHVIERDGSQRLEERDAGRGEQALRPPAVDHDHDAGRAVAFLAVGLDGDLSVDDHHHLLAELVHVFRDLFTRLIRDTTEEHLFAA